VSGQFAPAWPCCRGLAVPGLRHRHRGVDVHLDELTLAGISLAMSRSARKGEMNENEHDETGVDHQVDHFGHAPDVLDPVGVGEPESLFKAVPHVVPVEEVGVAPCSWSFRSTMLAMVDLARPRKFRVNHTTQGRLPLRDAWALRLISMACQCRLSARRSAKCRSRPRPWRW